MERKTAKTYGFWLALTQAVGILSGWLNREGIGLYREVAVKPPLTPPAAVFPVVWTILFALMGVGAARIRLAPASRECRRAIALFGLQLAANFLWSALFFGLGRYGLALVWLVGLWLLILGMIGAFAQVDLWAARLQTPYFLWVTFAAYLNFGVWRLNL